TRFSRDWSSDVCSSDLWAGGAGGGGRIAIRGRTHQFLGKITAHGGVAVNSGAHGGAGTVYLEPKPGAGVLIFDNDGVSAGTVWEDRKSVVEGKSGDSGG